MASTSLTPFQRADLYAIAFPDRVAAGSGFTRGLDATTKRERIFASWLGGQDYRNKSKLYGAFPAGLLHRVAVMFPEVERVLHLFSGSLTSGQVDEAWSKAVGLPSPTPSGTVNGSTPSHRKHPSSAARCCQRMVLASTGVSPPTSPR